MSLSFNKEKELVYRHNCEGCDRYPPDKNKKCLMCGYKSSDISSMYEHVAKMNAAYKRIYSDK